MSTVVKRFGMIPPTEISAHHRELFCEDTKSVLFDVEGDLIVIEESVQPGAELDTYTSSVEEMAKTGDIEEVSGSYSSMLVGLHAQVSKLIAEGLHPTYILVGKVTTFFSGVGLPVSPVFFGLRVGELKTYPDDIIIVTGSKSPYAPISGITKSYCIRVRQCVPQKLL